MNQWVLAAGALVVGVFLGMVLARVVLARLRMSAKYAAALGTAWASFAVMLWGMFAPQEYQLPKGAEGILNTLLTVNFILMFAGGEDVDPASVSALLAQAREQGAAEERARAAAQAAPVVPAPDHQEA